MAANTVQRKLTTILAADVAGYSRLAGADEEGIVSRLRALRHELIDPLISSHGGRTVKMMGDGRLVEFGSAVQAVRCAQEVLRGVTQRNANIAPDRRIEFRIGIHVGDVIVESDGDLMGDAVNIAARIEGLAEPGGICLSEDAWRHVRDRLGETFVDLGEQALKNIARRVRVFRLEVPAQQFVSEAPLALPDKPSIAVLPFTNMSGDTEQDYFCDGMVEDIITALSKLRWLFVIARNSSFTYKGRAVDVKHVGRELGVRYVLEGSVRKAGGRVRITGQLVDATKGAHIWADHFEGALDDIFDLQDRVTASVVAAIEPALRVAETERSRAKPTNSLGAYDYYLRALAAFHRSTRADIADALALCRKVIDTDGSFAAAYGLAAFCCMRRRAHGWAEDQASENATAGDDARRAIELGQNDPEALALGGIASAYFGGTMARAKDLIERALALNPNWALAWAALGISQCFCGEGDQGIVSMERALRLSPLDPEAFTSKAGIAVGHFVERRYGDAADWAERALREQPKFLLSLRMRMASCGLLGQSEEAAAALRTALEIDPGFSVAKTLSITPFQRPQDRAVYAEGLRKAGVPEG